MRSSILEMMPLPQGETFGVKIHIKNRNTMKRAIIICMFMCCALMLGGCVPLAIDMQRADGEVSLPVPAAQSVEEALGDVHRTVNQTVTLYVVSDEQQLVPVERVISVDREGSVVTEVLHMLLSMEAPVGASLPFPEGTRLLSVQRSDNAAVVDLSIEARNVNSQQQLFRMRSVIAASLIGLDGIEYVSILFAGQSAGLMDMPAGVISDVQEDLSAAWARLSAENEMFAADESESTSIERTAVIYYPTRDGKYIAPIVHPIRITGSDVITPLIQELISPCQPLDESLRSPFPQGASVMIQPPQIVENEDGERLVQLSFDASLIAMLEREGLCEWQLYAALTHTITGFVSDVDGLIISLGDGLLTRTVRDGKELSFTDGRMSVASYPDAVCRLCTVYMGTADGGLRGVQRPLDQVQASFARARLKLLFDGPQIWESEAARIMPDGVTADDILGIRIAYGEAVVNLSSNFYRCCQGLTPQQERVLIYAMVNTLTELSDVSAVRFQVEGETVDHLTDTIFLRDALMRNTGIIRNAQ